MAQQPTDLVQSKATSLKKLMDQCKKEIMDALPKHINPERMLRVAMTEARKIPALLECDQASFLGAVIQASQLGLEPGGALGHCYLIPFRNKKKGIMEVQFMVGYRGMLDLAYRSDSVSHAVARAVYDCDQFDWELGLDEKLVHRPGTALKKELTHVYCVVHLKNGGKLFDVMSKEEVDDIRARSMAADFGPWVSDYDAMAKKTVVRRLFKFMPVSIELQKAVGLDELADAGESQNNGAFIETTGRHVNTNTPQGRADELSQRLQQGEHTDESFERRGDPAPAASKPVIKGPPPVGKTHPPEPEPEPAPPLAPVSPEFEQAVNETPDPRYVK